MKKYYFIIILLITAGALPAQQVLTGSIKDAENKIPLHGVSVFLKNTKKGTTTDSTGNFILKNIPLGKVSIQFSYTGYEKKDIVVDVASGNFINIELAPSREKLQDVIIVSSSRTNSRIEDLPTKVEVLGTEEVGEENQIKPGNIASLLGDVAGIQIQPTNAATGNADMRIQGLQGKYTQILRDGMPLFGGYSGSFSILQIPPLDLQQIEMVKGASSTLYGGGAIAGMVNLVSKKPKLNAPEASLTLNTSTLKENNLNVFSSARNKQVGYTFFAGGTLQKQVDVNGDGFSDVPNIKSTFIHPRFFLYTSPKSTIVVGYTMNYEDRKGGDMNVLDNHSDVNHQFFIQNKSLRNTADIAWEQKYSNNAMLTAKASTSFFNRQIATNVFGMTANQTIWYSELAYSQKSKNHNWVAGINFNGDDFNKKQPDSSYIPNENSNTIGLFAQDDWKFAKQFTLQMGLRYDYHSLYGSFLLPRVSLMYKLNREVTMRLGGGLGYKTPTMFTAETDERDYHYLAGYVNNIQSEKSTGLNYDINYKTKAGEWDLTVNQTFFYNQIDHTMLLGNYGTAPVLYKYYNADKPLVTAGFETYVRAKLDELEIYFGYVYTNAKRKYDATNINLPLIAHNKIATVIAYEFNDHFRAGVEAAYTGKQYLDNGSTTTPYVFGAAMMNYKFRKVSFALNCENLFDYRQNKHNVVVFPPYANPSFPEIWAPLDGRVVNLSMMLKL
jgi:outer membrane receptor for ferrienterochelin and colicins